MKNFTVSVTLKIGQQSCCVILFFLILFQGTLVAQIAIPNTTTVSQNFNSMNAGTTTPANWKIQQSSSPTWAGATTALAFQASSGSPTSGGTYNWGATGATDRALGAMTSGAVSSPHSVLGWYRNTNAANLTQLSVAYNLERYRRNSAAASVQFFYSTDGTTWTAVAAGDIAAATIGTGTSLYSFAPQATFSVASFNITGLNIPVNGNIYLCFRLNTTGSNSQGVGIDDVDVTATFSAPCVPTSQPTLGVSNISVSEGCTSAQINFDRGDGDNVLIVMSTNCTITDPADQVDYSSNSTFGSGSTTGAGDFVVYNGSAATTIVGGLAAGTSYCFKIYEYNVNTVSCDENYLITATTTTFTTASDCAGPQIRSILVNACTAVEGFDEVVMIVNGNSALDIDDMQIDFPSGGSFCNSGCGAKTLVNNAAYVNSLNTVAGCALFQYANPIPAGATIVVFTGQTPTMTFDYSSECPGGGPYYVIFANNTTDNSGRFANNAGADRMLSIDFGSSSDAVTYTSNNANTNTDGDYVSFDNAGTPTYGNTATCSPPIPLPIELGYFYADCKEQKTTFYWQTITEEENNFFTLERTADGMNYEDLAKVQGAGTSYQARKYSCTIPSDRVDDYYYRLKQTDFNGIYSFSDLISVSCDDGDQLLVFPNPSSGIFIIKGYEKGAGISLHNEFGQEIMAIQSLDSNLTTELDLSGKANGVYFLKVFSSNKVETKKIVLRK